MAGRASALFRASRQFSVCSGWPPRMAAMTLLVWMTFVNAAGRGDAFELTQSRAGHLPFPLPACGERVRVRGGPRTTVYSVLSPFRVQRNGQRATTTRPRRKSTCHRRSSARQSLSFRGAPVVRLRSRNVSASTLRT